MSLADHSIAVMPSRDPVHESPAGRRPGGQYPPVRDARRSHAAPPNKLQLSIVERVMVAGMLIVLIITLAGFAGGLLLVSWAFIGKMLWFR
jgi:hypothetical protein